MKQTILSVLIATALLVGQVSIAGSNKSFAQNYNGVLAELKTYNCLASAEGTEACGEMELVLVRIMKNGNILHREGDKVMKVGILSKERISNLQKLIDQIPQGTLVDKQPEEEICADGGATWYVAVQSSGKKVDFSKNEGCHDYYLKNWEGKQLVPVLKGLYELVSIND